MKKALRIITLVIVLSFVAAVMTSCFSCDNRDPGSGSNTGNEGEVSSIRITAPPTKLKYQINEPLDMSGGIVLVTYTDATTKSLNMSSMAVSGFDSSTLGDKVVTVTYQTKEDKFVVSVVNTLLTMKKITYQLDGGKFPEGTSPPSQYVVGRETILLTPEKVFCEFLGWYDNEQLSGTPLTRITSNMNQDLTIYAKWLNIKGNNVFYVEISKLNNPLEPTTKKDELLKVSVVLGGKVLVGGFQMDINFDVTQVSLVESSLTSETNRQVEFTVYNGGVLIVWTNPGGGNIEESFRIITMEFKVITPSAGTCEFALNNASASVYESDGLGGVRPAGYNTQNKSIVIKETEKQ